MSDPPRPASRPPPPPPASRAGPAGITDTVRHVVSSLTGTPTLLVMVLLNSLMLGAAAWFLHGLEERRADIMLKVVALLERCIAR